MFLDSIILIIVLQRHVFLGAFRKIILEASVSFDTFVPLSASKGTQTESIKADLREIGFEVLTAVSMKIAVFWVVAPCHQGDDTHRPDDGGSKDL
jgi:hypothetical protein